MQTFRSTLNIRHEGINTTDAIKGTYLDNYRDMWDLYINNSTCDPKDLAAKTGDDARNEFLNKKAVFYPEWYMGIYTADAMAV